ncbi:hypothetical protein DBV15_06421 [Temnothorax longispinosus]|uniref:Uncharacterized protein n=1 Tax=Temnothorax longispinosus TaxID=300112 RepID=A0A4S2KT72_9HYME|nr:hypothetical protein DBV15_06421 [Temnothorax longispinosus]
MRTKDSSSRRARFQNQDLSSISRKELRRSAETRRNDKPELARAVSLGVIARDSGSRARTRRVRRADREDSPLYVTSAESGRFPVRARCRAIRPEHHRTPPAPHGDLYRVRRTAEGRELKEGSSCTWSAHAPCKERVSMPPPGRGRRITRVEEEGGHCVSERRMHSRRERDGHRKGGRKNEKASHRKRKIGSIMRGREGQKTGRRKERQRESEKGRTRRGSGGEGGNREIIRGGQSEAEGERPRTEDESGRGRERVRKEERGKRASGVTARFRGYSPAEDHREDYTLAAVGEDESSAGRGGARRVSCCSCSIKVEFQEENLIKLLPPLRLNDLLRGAREKGLGWPSESIARPPFARALERKPPPAR